MQKLEDSFEEYSSTTKKFDKSTNKKNKITINVACIFTFLSKKLTIQL